MAIFNRKHNINRTDAFDVAYTRIDTKLPCAVERRWRPHKYCDGAQINKQNHCRRTISTQFHCNVKCAHNDHIMRLGNSVTSHEQTSAIKLEEK